ncbi:MAG: VanW family protein [Lachnospiraceae bacterium]|nr:VanW family protein [Lachnospiraceae bacterium]
MWKKAVIYSLIGLVLVVLAGGVTGFVKEKMGEDRVAPGVTLCGRDVSGMTEEELLHVVTEELLPETVTELRCRFLPEMRETVENFTNLTIQGEELCLAVRIPLFRVCVEETVGAVAEASRDVKVWERLYEAVTGHPFRERQVTAVLVWEEDAFRSCAELLCKAVERERKEASVVWKDGTIKVTESRRGYRLNTENLWEEAERVASEARERLQEHPTEGLVLRFYVSGTALMPRLSKEQAEKCNTVIGEFTTFYAGAGGGRVQNIKSGAEKLHGKVILPGEEFSVAAVLMPFTEENGYASGGTYIDGQLSESIGGGVCQLSTTLYNALLQTKLEIAMRYPHSMPVGYVPLGRDAAIAGDYKDLRFVNNMKAPVILLCEGAEEKVKVTLYGPEEAKRGKVTFESVVTEQEEDSVIVEVYRVEKGEKGKEVRERVSRDRYKER